MHALLFSISLLVAGIPAWPPAAGGVAWLTPTEHDFGDIAQGEPVRFAFRFRNDGPAPLLIDNVRASCGCTTPDWPRTPVPADSTATINVEFNARVRGAFYKMIKVYVHGRRQAERLYVSGNVE